MGAQVGGGGGGEERRGGEGKGGRESGKDSICLPRHSRPYLSEGGPVPLEHAHLLSLAHLPTVGTGPHPPPPGAEDTASGHFSLDHVQPFLVRAVRGEE